MPNGRRRDSEMYGDEGRPSYGKYVIKIIPFYYRMGRDIHCVYRAKITIFRQCSKTLKHDKRHRVTHDRPSFVLLLCHRLYGFTLRPINICTCLHKLRISSSSSSCDQIESRPVFVQLCEKVFPPPPITWIHSGFMDTVYVLNSYIKCVIVNQYDGEREKKSGEWKW